MKTGIGIVIIVVYVATWCLCKAAAKADRYYNKLK